jgi:putative flippase GtrA
MAKWLLVAGITFTSDLIIFIILFAFTKLLLVSNVLSFILSTVVNFILHKYWTFKKNHVRKNLVKKYIFALFISISLNSLFLYTLSHYLDPLYSKLLVSVILIPFNFLLMSKFTFKS